MGERSLSELKIAFADIEARLGPVIRRPWIVDGRRNPGAPAERIHPLDEAGVRSERDHLAEELAGVYPTASAAEREEIRGFFKTFTAVRWAMWPRTGEANTAEGLRNCLLHLSMTDGSGDYRDDLVALTDIRAKAVAAGLQINAITAEIAALSSRSVAENLIRIFSN